MFHYYIHTKIPAIFAYPGAISQTKEQHIFLINFLLHTRPNRMSHSKSRVSTLWLLAKHVAQDQVAELRFHLRLQVILMLSEVQDGRPTLSSLAAKVFVWRIHIRIPETCLAVRPSKVAYSPVQNKVICKSQPSQLSSTWASTWIPAILPEPSVVPSAIPVWPVSSASSRTGRGAESCWAAASNFGGLSWGWVRV